MNPIILMLAPFFSGILGTFFFGKHSKKTKIPGLLFHSVLPEPGYNLSHFPSETFKNFIKIVYKQQLQPITISDTIIAGKNDCELKKILITFDDGLENIYSNAIEILNEFNFKATIFCVTGFLGRESSWDVYRGSTHLNAASVRLISSCGHEIGSHSHTHANLPYLSRMNLIKELRDSKKILEDITGKEIKSISFPHGSWDQRVWNTAQEEGYEYASLYRGHARSNDPKHFPVLSAGRFDTEKTLIEKLQLSAQFSPSIAFSKIASHFAKGTPLWKFRRNYNVIGY
jgi:peptidoglycan/xylan/chitin deacetylase (PgdA/CDA1 family)